MMIVLPNPDGFPPNPSPVPEDDYLPPRLEPLACRDLEFYAGFAPGDRVVSDEVGGGEVVGVVESVRDKLHTVRFPGVDLPRRMFLAGSLRLAPDDGRTGRQLFA